MPRTEEDIQDELLVLECQSGDGEALRALYDRWQPRFARHAWRLTAEREAARDIVQDAWLAIVRGLRRLDDPARFRVWGYRIVSNKCADWLRRRVVERRAERDLAAGSSAICSASETDSEDDVAAMREALAALPREQRAILSLHYLDGMGIAEMSRVLSVPAGTVKSRLFHARNQLRRLIERTKS